MNTTTSKTIFITGATGLVGSHATEEALKRGHRVRALVRPTSDTRWLDQWGVETIVGDLEDPKALRAGVAGADWVFNCAAKVGDWGTLDEFRRLNVDALRLLLDAAVPARLERFVHVSSLGVYEGRDHHGTDETVPPAANSLDAYTRSKTEAEALVLEYHRRHGLPAAIVRPGFIYGERDRTVLPKLLLEPEARQLHVLWVRRADPQLHLREEPGSWDLPRRRNPAAVGEVFNLTDGQPVTKKQFVGRVAELAGLKPPTRRLPLRLAKFLANVVEGGAKLRGAEEPADHQQGPLQVSRAQPRLLDRKGTPRARLSTPVHLRAGNRAGHGRASPRPCRANRGRRGEVKRLSCLSAQRRTQPRETTS